jgi:quinolinate synthase
MALPEEYRKLPRSETFERIRAAKQTLGGDVFILGHYYQSDDVIQFADLRGDSLELSRAAAAQKQARYIVFCGVSFMAETAAMLCEPYQKVLLPAQEAACPMALMADVDDAQIAWDALVAAWGAGAVLPITYQNSSAELKAFCGRRGGAVCTSANAGRVFKWAFDQGKRILFFPDEWLGTNTALALGLRPAEIAVWEPSLPAGGEPDLSQARVVAWKGYCHVHTDFTVEQVTEARRRYPNAIVIVHPECPVPVVQASDMNGSTSFILKQVQKAPAGAVFFIGTECNMVDRLAKENPDKTVLPLTRSFCHSMARTTPAHLLYTLERLLAGELVGLVTVPDEIRHWANVALERMLSL